LHYVIDFVNRLLDESATSFVIRIII
jgi:hypothetical protein